MSKEEEKREGITGDRHRSELENWLKPQFALKLEEAGSA